MSKADDLVEKIRELIDVEENHNYVIMLEKEPNSNVIWVKLHKMYDEDFTPINLTSIWGDKAIQLYKQATTPREGDTQ